MKKKQLQKYVIVIDGEDIEAQNIALREALYCAGFNVCYSREPGEVFDDRFISVNECVDGDFGVMSFDVESRINECHMKVLLASYVIENIYELEGAKQPWEIPPEGYRIVSDDELRSARNTGSNINDIVRVISIGGSANWCIPICFSIPNDWLSESGFNVAVPVDFKFETKEPWEIPEPGYRLVTDEERERFEKPQCVRVHGIDRELESKWFPRGNDQWSDCYNYAVPVDYVFEDDVIEVTMADLERSYGKKVKIVK